MRKTRDGKSVPGFGRRRRAPPGRSARRRLVDPRSVQVDPGADLLHAGRRGRACVRRRFGPYRRVPGVGITAAGNEADTWGEFGARLESQLTKKVALDVDLNGTTGGGALGTILHGGAGLSYRF